MKKSIVVILLALICSPAAMALLEDLEPGQTDKYFEPSSPKLKEPVDINFQDTDLSNVLLLLAKIADINLVFPQELDRKISIKVKNSEVFKAIKEILEINDLKHSFKNGTLKVSQVDLNRASQQSVPILYTKASEVAEMLNSTVFRQISMSKPIEAPEPFAFVYPNKNTVIISGNPSQIEAGIELIQELDKKPNIDFLSFEHITADDGIKVLGTHFDNKNIEVHIEDEQTIFFKGAKEAIEEAKEVLGKFDREQKPVELDLEIYKVSASKTKKRFFAKNQDNQATQPIEPIALNKAIVSKDHILESELFNSFKGKLEKIKTEKLELARDGKEVLGIQIKARRDVLQQDHFELELNKEKLSHLNGSSYVAYRAFNQANKELRKKLRLKKDDQVLILLK